MKELGVKIRRLREEKGITREGFCGDQSVLSVRQFARIEAGECIPTLERMRYIAQQFGESVSFFIDETSLELPKKYKELKYQILRTPVYTDDEKIQEREEQFDEIYSDYYDRLPEDEKLTVDSLRTILDTFSTRKVDFGAGLLEESLEQLKLKHSYQMNDLILIKLYLLCANASSEYYDELFIHKIFSLLMKHYHRYDTEELFIINSICMDLFSIYFKEKNISKVEKVLQVISDTIEKVHDFKRLPVQQLLQWKYKLYLLNDKKNAEECYLKAIAFAQMTGDSYLEKQLMQEWKKDTQGT
ncbi:transcriptional regulator with XRE-family HTH domain [Streptococcus gallinaceus]|uniref:helix-turn-helix domain-containing protein n=1 Tax=Streptococcus gallinaceus TaxID=165758 RepID=UPI00209D7CB8|nr:XRE family transcriptional regulator [Streptococcus gallinaceus]MCP1640349.1 transcriptional regulator with XRE-family HTH domain [Streptococcus gallinaceus]MCP1771132.1 transcriptional regulator with XRE-family HTH domain [Streptococcus gallinaceus]